MPGVCRFIRESCCVVVPSELIPPLLGSDPKLLKHRNSPIFAAVEIDCLISKKHRLLEYTQQLYIHENPQFDPVKEPKDQRNKGCTITKPNPKERVGRFKRGFVVRERQK